jgi:hypothetical protein
MAGTVEIEGVLKASRAGKPSASQMKYLRRGLDQAGGKLPLFDDSGQRINEQTICSCLKKGWCEAWARNPVKPDWLVCKLTDAGRTAAERN